MRSCTAGGTFALAAVLLVSSCCMVPRHDPGPACYPLVQLHEDGTETEGAFPRFDNQGAPQLNCKFRIPDLRGETFYSVSQSNVLGDILRTGAKIEISWPDFGSNDWLMEATVFPLPVGPFIRSVTPEVFSRGDTVRIELMKSRGSDYTIKPTPGQGD